MGANPLQEETSIDSVTTATDGNQILHVTTSPSTVHKRKTSQGTKWATSAKGQALGFPEPGTERAPSVKGQVPGFPVPGIGRALPRDWTGRKEDELTS